MLYRICDGLLVSEQVTIQYSRIWLVIGYVICKKRQLYMDIKSLSMSIPDSFINKELFKLN